MKDAIAATSIAATNKIAHGEVQLVNVYGLACQQCRAWLLWRQHVTADSFEGCALQAAVLKAMLACLPAPQPLPLHPQQVQWPSWEQRFRRQ